MELLLLTADPDPGSVLPALGLLAHQVRVVAPEVQPARRRPGDVVLVDARHDLMPRARCAGCSPRTGVAVPLVAVLAEGGLVALSADWGVDDVVLDTAGPAEVDARLGLLARRRRRPPRRARGGAIRAGELVIDEHSYSARLRGRPLDLTYKEFELLKYLAQHPGRVFSRAQLLQEIWGYDYFGGTRTVDVHVRRLRAKLGTEHEALIGTVRNVGYKLDQQVADATAAAAVRAAGTDASPRLVALSTPPGAPACAARPTRGRPTPTGPARSLDRWPAAPAAPTASRPALRGGRAAARARRAPRRPAPDRPRRATAPWSATPGST